MENEFTPKFVDSPEELSVNQVDQQEQQFDASTEPTPQEPTPTQTEAPASSESEVVFSANESSLQDETQVLEREVLSYLSERLGRELNSFDDFNTPSYELHDGVRAIADFVNETGRNPEDWFTYQSLNPENMDDMTAVMVNMSAKYPNLSQDEVRTLVQSKYKVDSDRYDEEEVKLSQLQLKIDSEEARKAIQEVREKYKYERAQQSTDDDSPIFDEEWIQSMTNETMALEAIEFSLGDGNNFKFGIDPSYSKSLVSKNANLENYFDQYINDDGGWNFDKFNADRTVLDNIQKIVSAVYRKGLGDGQRGLLNTSANVKASSPGISSQNNSSDPVADQIRMAMGMSNSMTFKL